MRHVGIVGYGAIGPIHAKALEEVTKAQLYAVCDHNPERLAACTQQYPVKQYADYDEMLKDPVIDTVHICVPHYLHFEMTIKALEAGKRVVLEKPVTMTEQEFEWLRARPDADKICVVLQNRKNRCVEAAKAILQEKRLGKVLGAKAFLTWQRTEAYYQGADWRGKRKTEGGGVLINQAVHTLDYFSYLLGGVCSVSAQAANLSLQGKIEVEDTICARLCLQNDVTGVFFATNGYMENSPPFFEVVLEKGVLRYQDRKLWVNGVLTEEDEAALCGKAYWGSSHALLIREYYDENKYFTVQDAANTMGTVFSIYKSAMENSREYSVQW